MIFGRLVIRIFFTIYLAWNTFVDRFTDGLKAQKHLAYSNALGKWRELYLRSL